MSRHATTSPPSHPPPHQHSDCLITRYTGGVCSDVSSAVGRGWVRKVWRINTCTPVGTPLPTTPCAHRTHATHDAYLAPPRRGTRDSGGRHARALLVHVATLPNRCQLLHHTATHYLLPRDSLSVQATHCGLCVFTWNSCGPRAQNRQHLTFVRPHSVPPVLACNSPPHSISFCCTPCVRVTDTHSHTQCVTWYRVWQRYC